MDPAMIAALGVAVAGVGLLGYGYSLAREDRVGEQGAAYLREATARPGRPLRQRSDDRPLRAEASRTRSADEDDDFTRRLSEPFVRRVVRPNLDRVAAMGAAFLPADHRAHIRVQLSAAGLDGRRRPEEVIAAQVVGGIVGLVFGTIVIINGGLSIFAAVLCTLVLAIIGVAAPQVWLSHQVEARREAIRRDLPDTLDLLAISVEAGVGLEGAMAVVTERMRSPLADELARTLQEMGLGLSRHDALTNMKHRSNVPELTTFIGALLQADVLGMPIGKVLKIQATEMRAKRRQWSRERAAKLPVKILFPLVACIFPAVLVVILGPALGQITEAMK